MKQQKDSFQVRIMDLSESMSNYLRLSNNCCEKCLANTEISSRNCDKLYHIRSSPGSKFPGPSRNPLDDLWSSPCPRIVLSSQNRLSYKKCIKWIWHIFRLFNKTSDINRNISNLFTTADTANANLTSLRMKIDDIQVKSYSSKQSQRLSILEPNGTNDEWNWKIKNRFCCVSRFENDFFNSLQSRYYYQGSKDYLFKGLWFEFSDLSICWFQCWWSIW